MRIDKQRVTCKKCNGVSEVDVVFDAPIAVTLASMKAAICSHCGADSNKLGLGGEYSDKPQIDAPLMDRADWWRNRGEIGTSSLTIWESFTGGHNPHGYTNYPLDPDDFSRCKKLLDLIPEWRASLETVSAKHPWFAPFVEAWPRFEEFWAEEYGSGWLPKLYEEMRVAAKKADALREKAA